MLSRINIVSGTSRHSVGRCAGACDATSVMVSAAGLAPPWAGTTGGRGQAPRARRGGGSGRRAAPRVLPRAGALPEGEGLPLGEGPGWAVSPRPGGSKPRPRQGFAGPRFAPCGFHRWCLCPVGVTAAARPRPVRVRPALWPCRAATAPELHEQGSGPQTPA